MSGYNEVHDLVYHGGGGYSYSEVYNMPIYLRRYSITRINNYLKDKKEAEEKIINDAKNNRK